MQRLSKYFTRQTFQRLVLGMLLVGLMTPGVVAQSDLGSIRGTVLDATGAVIPGATVQLTSTDQAGTQSATADNAGRFHFEALVRGSYKVTAGAAGFSTAVQALTLQVSQIQEVVFRLQPGVATEVITVTDAAPIVDMASSSSGTVIENSQVQQLPLNGRNFTQLALLAPGVTRGGYGSAASGGGGQSETWRYSDTGGAALSVNGLRPQANNYELDGLDNNDALVNTIVFFPPVEDTEEFRVTTAVAPAEFGQAGGAIVQTSIKSGTDKYHGSVFFFDRDQIFDANPNYSFGKTAQSKPAYRRQQFGGTLGGPVPFLHHKLFLFGGYQALRMTTPEGESWQSVPTDLMRQGNFSELVTYSTANGYYSSVSPLPNVNVTGCAKDNTQAMGTIYDPTTCKPFPVVNINGVPTPNVIPADRQNQAAINYFNAFPEPNNTNESIASNYFVNPQEVQKFNDFDGRMDWKPTDTDSFFVRYSYGQDIQIKQSLFTKLPAGYGSGYNPTHPRGEAAGYTHLFGSNMVNEFRYGHMYFFYGYVPPMDNEAVSANLGIVNANRNALLGGGAAINGGWVAYTGDGGAYTVPQSAHQFVDQLSWTKGNHTFKFGTSVERRQVKFFQGQNAKGYFGFDAGDFTGFSGSDMMAAFTNNYSIGVSSSYFVTNNWQTGYFAQDDWKATPRLTLNLGVRYDLYTFPTAEHNYQSDFILDPSSPYYMQLVQAGTNGLQSSVVKTNYGDFAPRVGFAYNLLGNGKMSLRGGYGIYYFLDRGGIGNQLSNNADFNGSASYQDLPAQGGYRINFTGQGPACNGNFASCNENIAAATGSLPLPAFGSTVNRAYPVNVSLLSLPTSLPTSMIQQWNLQVERELTQSISLTAAYVGTTGRHLMTWIGPNSQVMAEAPNAKQYPAFNGITQGVAEGSSSYNGLQVFLNSRMAHGVQLTTAYTWSHALSNSEGAFGTGSNQYFVFPTAGFTGAMPTVGEAPTTKVSLDHNYGNSDQDDRQVFTFSALVQLPFGRGRMFGTHIAKPVDYVIGGWQLNTITSLNSGQPFSITTGEYYYDGGEGGTPALVGASLTNYANRAGSTHYTKSLHGWFDTSKYTHPEAITPNGQTSTFAAPGNMHRNDMFGPSYRNVDLSLFKQFALIEGVTGEFRAEAFNLTNTPKFTNPNGSLDGCASAVAATCAANLTSTDTGAFGQIEGVRGSSERQLQLALRFSF